MLHESDVLLLSETLNRSKPARSAPLRKWENAAVELVDTLCDESVCAAPHDLVPRILRFAASLASEVGESELWKTTEQTRKEVARVGRLARELEQALAELGDGAAGFLTSRLGAADIPRDLPATADELASALDERTVETVPVVRDLGPDLTRRPR